MKRIALIGMPNTGKSTLFNLLSGGRAKVGNWPGITVDFLSAKILLAGQMVELIDLPGIYDLEHGHSEDEKIVALFLQKQAIDIVLVVINIGQIERQLPLLVQLIASGHKIFIALNMLDEARKLGATVDLSSIHKSLRPFVCAISAKYGDGLDKLRPLLSQTLSAPKLKPKSEINLQSENLPHALKKAINIPSQSSAAFSDKIDKVLLHRYFGLPIFFVAMFFMFSCVFIIGKPIQDGMTWVFDLLRNQVFSPILHTLNLPNFIYGLLLDGLYSGLTTVASFLPLIVLFFWGMAIIEDTGYLSRAAFLMDTWMTRFGLDGRSFVLILMGFGCNVPAIMGTRVMRSRGLRLLTMLAIPFALCSARLQVFLFFIAALFPSHTAPTILFSLYLVSLASTMLTSLLFKTHLVNTEAFILEIPPYRWPTLRQILLRAWHEVSHFLKRATRFIVMGVILIWLLTNLPIGVTPAGTETWAGQIGSWLNPILEPIGINPKLTITLFFGFIAKEIVIGALAVIYASSANDLMSGIAADITQAQAYSFMLFTLIYTPCISTIATIFQESKSWRFSLLALFWPLSLAWLVSFVFYQMVN